VFAEYLPKSIAAKRGEEEKFGGQWRFSSIGKNGKI